MYRRRSQCCPGYFESGDLCVRKYEPFTSTSLIVEHTEIITVASNNTYSTVELVLGSLDAP